MKGVDRKEEGEGRRRREGGKRKKLEKMRKGEVNGREGGSREG